MKVLHASKIGFPCARNLWYAANEYEGKTSERSQRIFDVGNALEPMVVKWLRDDGWEVEYNPGSQNAAFEVVVPVEGGELRGHPDAFISREGERPILIDIKTMNDRAFRLWKSEGTVRKYPQYVDQLLIYAFGVTVSGRSTSRIGIVGINKNTSELWIDFFDFDPTLFIQIQNRATAIFKMTTPPEANCPAQDWCCGYCEFSHLCELCKRKTNNAVGDEVATTEDEEVINAMEILQEARKMNKEAKELETGAKSVLDEKVRAKGVKSVSGGGYVLTFKESVKSQFDQAAFKKAHPEMVSEFTKSVISLTYELKEI